MLKGSERASASDLEVTSISKCAAIVLIRQQGLVSGATRHAGCDCEQASVAKSSWPASMSSDN